MCCMYCRYILKTFFKTSHALSELCSLNSRGLDFKLCHIYIVSFLCCKLVFAYCWHLVFYVALHFFEFSVKCGNVCFAGSVSGQESQSQGIHLTRHTLEQPGNTTSNNEAGKISFPPLPWVSIILHHHSILYWMSVRLMSSTYAF